jgi:hypothetical protein
MLSSGQIKLQELSAVAIEPTTPNNNNSIMNHGSDKSDGIRKEVEVAITTAPNTSHRESQGNFAFASGPMRTSTRTPK